MTRNTIFRRQNGYASKSATISCSERLYRRHEKVRRQTSRYCGDDHYSAQSKSLRSPGRLTLLTSGERNEIPLPNIAVVGVNSDGRPEVLGMDTGPGRPKHWTGFLRKLIRRSLRGVKLVTSDSHENCAYRQLTETQGKD